MNSSSSISSNADLFEKKQSNTQKGEEPWRILEPLGVTGRSQSTISSRMFGQTLFKTTKTPAQIPEDTKINQSVIMHKPFHFTESNEIHFIHSNILPGV